MYNFPEKIGGARRAPLMYRVPQNSPCTVGLKKNVKSQPKNEFRVRNQGFFYVFLDSKS